MTVKKAKAKPLTPTMKRLIKEANDRGFEDGRVIGRQEIESRYQPDPDFKLVIDELVRTIDSWNRKDNAIVQILATDCERVHTSTMSIKLLRKIASELKRLGYK